MGLSAARDCVISWAYSLTIFAKNTCIGSLGNPSKSHNTIILFTDLHTVAKQPNK